jgi:hypothetical protein
VSSVYLVNMHLEDRSAPATDNARYDVVDGKAVLTLLPDCDEGDANVAQAMMMGVYDYAHDRVVLPTEGQTFLNALMTQRENGYWAFQESHRLVDGTGEVRTAHGGAYIKWKAGPAASPARVTAPTQGNPWPGLPAKPSYSLPIDRPILDRNPAANSLLHLELHPVPFIGNPNTARVLLLNLNPGYGAQDLADERVAEFRRELRRSLLPQGKDGFFLAHPKFHFAAGTQWWMKQLRWLIEATSREHVIRNLACVEWFPYHSESFTGLNETLPSQLYSFNLVQGAADRGVELIVMRAAKQWHLSIPTLDQARTTVLRNPRNPWLSPTNLGADNFRRVVTALTDG